MRFRRLPAFQEIQHESERRTGEGKKRKECAHDIFLPSCNNRCDGHHNHEAKPKCSFQIILPSLGGGKKHSSLLPLPSSVAGLGRTWAGDPPHFPSTYGVDTEVLTKSIQLRIKSLDRWHRQCGLRSVLDY